VDRVEFTRCVVVDEPCFIAQNDAAICLDKHCAAALRLGRAASVEDAAAEHGAAIRDVDGAAASCVAGDKGRTLHIQNTTTHLQSAANVGNAAAGKGAVLDVQLCAVNDHLTVQHQSTNMDFWRACTDAKQRRAYGLL